MYDNGIWFGVVYVLRELKLEQGVRLGLLGGWGGNYS